MSNKDDCCDWINEWNIRPDQLKCRDPRKEISIEKNSRLFHSMLSISISEMLFERQIDQHSLDQIDFEQLCSEEKNLKLVWSDDISLTFVFLSSLAQFGCYSKEHLLQGYFHWWMNGYMSPTGLCFTPRLDIKKSIDLFGESQLAHSLGFDLDLSKRNLKYICRSSTFIRLSPIGYFYRNHSSRKRLEIIEDCGQEMFANQVSMKLLSKYTEILVQSLQGCSKESILEYFQLDPNENDSTNRALSKLFEILSNDENNFERGIDLSLKTIDLQMKSAKYANPLDSDSIIVLLLYLQIGSAIYDRLPKQCLNKNIYAYDFIQSLVKWIVYRSEEDLLSIEP